MTDDTRALVRKHPTKFFEFSDGSIALRGYGKRVVLYDDPSNQYFYSEVRDMDLPNEVRAILRFTEVTNTELNGDAFLVEPHELVIKLEEKLFKDSFLKAGAQNV